MRERALVGAACLAFLCGAGCEPPGAPEAEPVPANQITDFKTLYSENCSGCHGNEGKKGPGRILNDSLYLTFAPREAIQHVIEDGRPGTAMPPWLVSQGGPLTQKQVNALVDGMEKNWKKPLHLSAPLPAYDAGSVAGDATSGKKLFARGCFACHAPGALVGPVTDPSYLSLSTNQNLRTSIVVGRPDLIPPMPDYRIVNAGRPLSDQNVADLVAYLASLRPADSPMAKQEDQSK